MTDDLNIVRLSIAALFTTTLLTLSHLAGHATGKILYFTGVVI